MSRTLGVLLLFILSVAPALQSQNSAATPRQVLKLEDAVALALQNNRVVHIASLEVEKLGEDLSAQRTHRLPAFQVSVLASSLLTPLSFEYKQGAFGEDSNGQPIPAHDTDITTPRRLNAYFLNSISQPLSQLYKINLSLRAKALSRDIASEDLRVKRHNVRNQVTRLYYDMAQTQTALDASLQAVEFYRELDRVTDQFLVQQVVLKAESIDVKMRLAREQLQSVKLRNDLETQQERMNQLLGRDLRQRFRVDASGAPTLVELDLGIAQARALEQRPELRQAQLKVKQANYDRRIKKAEYIPDVSLNFQHLSFTNLEMLPRNVVSAGLTFSWEPFDWGRKKHELVEKSKGIEQAETSLKETEAQVLIDVNSEFRKVQEATASLRVAQLSIDAAKEKLRVTSDEFRVQSVRLDQVLQAQTGVSNAASDYQRALGNYWSARADLVKATGED